MATRVEELGVSLSKIEHGFKKIEKCAEKDFASYDTDSVAELARKASGSDIVQLRMYGVFLLGYLSANSGEALHILKKDVSRDDDWRVQEILAKSFDRYCRDTGYKRSLPVIDEWLRSDKPNVRRAVTEGLRIWTVREYFRDHPKEAIRRLSALRDDPSEYVRKSVGNALRDVSKKYPDLVRAELATWNPSSRGAKQVYKLASRLMGVATQAAGEGEPR